VNSGIKASKILQSNHQPTSNQNKSNQSINTVQPFNHVSSTHAGHICLFHFIINAAAILRMCRIQEEES
jgi:hypothetical protein